MWPEAESNTTTRFSSRSSNSCNFTPRIHQKQSQKVRNFRRGPCPQTPLAGALRPLKSLGTPLFKILDPPLPTSGTQSHRLPIATKQTLPFPQAFVWWQWTFTNVSRRCTDAASLPGLFLPLVNFWSLAKTGGGQGRRMRLMQIPPSSHVAILLICLALHLHFKFDWNNAVTTTIPVTKCVSSK